MAYFDSFNKEIWHELGLSYEMFKPYPLSQNDIERSIIIADELISKYSERNMDKSQSMAFGSVLQSAATVFYNLGMHNTAKRAVRLIHVSFTI